MTNAQARIEKQLEKKVAEMLSGYTAEAMFRGMSKARHTSYVKLICAVGIKAGMEIMAMPYKKIFKKKRG